MIPVRSYIKTKNPWKIHEIKKPRIKSSGKNMLFFLRSPKIHASYKSLSFSLAIHERLVVHWIGRECLSKTFKIYIINADTMRREAIRINNNSNNNKNVSRQQKQYRIEKKSKTFSYDYYEALKRGIYERERDCVIVDAHSKMVLLIALGVY